jgi:hypothetical protein
MLMAYHGSFSDKQKEGPVRILFCLVGLINHYRSVHTLKLGHDSSPVFLVKDSSLQGL